MTRGLGGSLLPYRVRDFHSLFLASFPGAQPDPSSSHISGFPNSKDDVCEPPFENVNSIKKKGKINLHFSIFQA